MTITSKTTQKINNNENTGIMKTEFKGALFYCTTSPNRFQDPSKGPFYNFMAGKKNVEAKPNNHNGYDYMNFSSSSSSIKGISKNYFDTKIKSSYSDHDFYNCGSCQEYSSEKCEDLECIGINNLYNCHQE